MGLMCEIFIWIDAWLRWQEQKREKDGHISGTQGLMLKINCFPVRSAFQSDTLSAYPCNLTRLLFLDWYLYSLQVESEEHNWSCLAPHTLKYTIYCRFTALTPANAVEHNKVPNCYILHTDKLTVVSHYPVKLTVAPYYPKKLIVASYYTDKLCRVQAYKAEHRGSC